jgi:muramoyltetrapeptide carboxypeptidase
MVTFHGPMGVDSWSSGVNARYINQMITLAQSGVEYSNISPYVITTITTGTATGKLYGGNLSVFISLIGSPYMPDLRGAILFLEGNIILK